MEKDFSKIRIFCATPAAGKSWLADHDSRFVDIDALESKYKHAKDLDISAQAIQKEFQGKGIKVIREDHRSWIIDQIPKILDSGKIILSANHKHILDFLSENKIPFAFVDYDPKYKYIYRKRMEERGNDDNFINRMLEHREESHRKHKEDPSSYGMIELVGDEYISDALWRIFGQPDENKS